jgi:aerobic-type carbon monoxide dehydrogenase small subunit (CoxS/CutS family)
MPKISRRLFAQGTGASLAATALPLNSLAATTDLTPVELTVNGTTHKLEVEPRWTLAEVLRDHLSLTGTRIGCDRSECGACTVLVDDKPVYSCSQLAVWMQGRRILTVEGLSVNGKLDPLQEAFIEHDGPQCGFCTSGQLMSAKALLNTNPHPTRDQIQHAMAGNICRCSNYNRYVEAVLAASQPAERRTIA